MKVIGLSFTLTVSIIFTSCSVWEIRHNKVNDGSVTLKGPDFPIVEEGLTLKNKSRMPASITTKTQTKKDKEKMRNTKLLSYNNKMIYFLTLYSQFLNFKKISHSPKELPICPNFHSVLVSNQDEFSKILNSPPPSMSVITDNMIPEITTDQAKLFPQYFLPISLEAQHPSVWDMGQGKNKITQNELLTKSLKVHTEKIFVELKELCEYGQSDNYYIFENLVTHINEHGAFKSTKDGLKALLKTSVFSNMYILNGFNLNSPQQNKVNAQLSVHNGFEKEVIFRLETEWITDYFNEVARKRAQVVSR